MSSEAPEQKIDDVARLLAVIDVQNQLASAALDLDEILAVVTRTATDLTEAHAAVVEVPEGDEMVYRAVAGTAVAHRGTRVKVNASLTGLCLLERRVLRSDDTSQDDRVDGEACRRVGAASMVCVPLVVEDEVAGVLKVYADHVNAFDESDVAILGQLSATIAAHMVRAGEFERKTVESRQDMLTDLANRRAYEERLAVEVARAERYGHPLSLVLFDLDGFKRVNDEEGHPAGDDALRRVADAIRHTRLSDDCYRIGGDEFALVLPETPEDGAAIAADRVAAEIADRLRTAGVTASYGIAPHGAAATADELHATADERLLAAKGAR